ncbi:MAG: tetratricopeptide repeat protein [Candidatus Igneacidithiobacillus chanchocoensis]
MKRLTLFLLVAAFGSFSIDRALAAEGRWHGPFALASAACLQHDAQALQSIQKEAKAGSHTGIETMAAYWVCANNRERATPWLEKASAMGSGWASQVLARYSQGQPPSAANTRVEQKYLVRAALQGNGWAARELAILYLNGAPGLAANAQKASYWASYAEDVKEIVPNTFYLAESYAKGWGVPVNAAKAKELYAETFATLRKASKEGDPYADMLFFLAYSKGYGVPKDRSQALHWLEQAAAKGYPEAIAALHTHANGDESHD